MYSITIVFSRKVTGFCLMYTVSTKLRARMQSILRSWKKNRDVFSIYIHEDDKLIGVWHNENNRIANQVADLV